jgi:hypothetical protein
MIDIAVIVEPRNHEYLKPVIDNIIRNINIETPIMIFHSSINEDFIKKNYNDYISNNKIILSKLKQKNLSINQYNILLTSIDFWNKINGENVLIFQTDSCLCRHINTFDFTEYLNYGFIGAPSKLEYPIPWQNGGISIRKKSLMIKALKYNNGPSEMNEDKFYTVANRRIVNPSPFELANKFSVEQYYFDNPLAIHKAWKYLSKEDWDSLKHKFPEISLTFNNL